MGMLDSIGIAVAALWAHPLRSLLTMLGIIIGVAAVIAMVAVGAGAQVRVAEQIRTLGSNLLMVQPGSASRGGTRLAGGTRHTLTEDDAVAISEDVPGVLVAAPSVRGSSQIVNGNRNWSAVVNGTTPDYFIAREWSIGKGRAFSAHETGTAAKVALLGTSVAAALFPHAEPVGKTIRIADVPFDVVGVLAEKGADGSGRDQDDIVFVPISTAKLRLLGGAHTVNRGSLNYVLVKVADASRMDAVQAEISGLLRDRHRLAANAPADFRVWNPAASLAAQHEATRTLSFLLAAIASISLVVGGISIMNIMLVSVTERTREIGVRLAVGARRRDIWRQFLVEAVILCLVGGAIGIALGIAGAAVLSKLAGWSVFIGPEAVAAAVASAAAVGIFFGFYPALRASRLQPMEALRSE